MLAKDAESSLVFDVKSSTAATARTSEQRVQALGLAELIHGFRGHVNGRAGPTDRGDAASRTA